MKLFCGCTSEFDYLGLIGVNCRISVELPVCKKCGFYLWVDADYENMMFDLKTMNL